LPIKTNILNLQIKPAKHCQEANEEYFNRIRRMANKPFSL